MSGRHWNKGTPEAVTRTYHALLAYLREHDYPPTLAELATATNTCASGVLRHLDYLEAWGYIHRPERTARGIVLMNRAHLQHPPERCHPRRRETIPM